MCGLIERMAKLQPVHAASYIVEPRNAASPAFFIINMASEAQADHVRIRHYRAFSEIKCYVGDHLTLKEQDRRNRIKEIMAPYW